MPPPEREAPPPVIDVDALAGAPAAGGLDAAPAPLFDPARLADRVRRWTGILATFFTAQVATQATGLAAGLLFVNFLPVGEFAFYTLASSILVTLAFVTDLGCSAALLHFFHRARREGADFAPWAAAVASLRRRLFLAGAPLAALALCGWGAERGVAWPALAATAALIVVAAWFQIGGSIAVLRLRLEERFGASYRAEIAGGATRLVLAGALVAAGWTLATPAVATATVAIAVTAWLARGGAAADAADGARLARDRRAVLRYLAPSLPGALYFAVQGQFVVWLAATFGGTANLAQVGALGRLGLIVGLFSGLGSVVFLPKLVRITDERTFRARYLQFGAFLATIAAALVTAAWLAPRAFLFLLGGSYRGLDRELLLVVAGSGLTLLGGYAVAVNSARSWNRWQVAAVAVLIACQVALALTLPLATTAGVLTFGLGSTAIGLAAQLTITAIGFSRPELVRW